MIKTKIKKMANTFINLFWVFANFGQKLGYPKMVKDAPAPIPESRAPWTDAL
jgi:hypothetical protein